MRRWKMTAGLFVLAALFCAMAGMGTPAAEAVKVKVEVDVDVDTESGTAKPKKPKKPAPENYPVTLRNRTGSKLYVALVYYDGNAKDWRCRGWWGVEPGKERSFKLNHVRGRDIYAYIEYAGKGNRPFTRTGTANGVNRHVTSDAFSYLDRDAKKAKLKKPYKVHFEHCETGDDNWWSLTMK
ncbi:MAG: DUF1036 domain-containing protein [Fretibacterium sp.]|nr:DUF1036 domain-containing protein [Fretibacterium sp.]